MHMLLVTSQGAERGHGKAGLRTSLLSTPAPPTPRAFPAGSGAASKSCCRVCMESLQGLLDLSSTNPGPWAQVIRWAAYSQGHARSLFV